MRFSPMRIAESFCAVLRTVKWRVQGCQAVLGSRTPRQMYAAGGGLDNPACRTQLKLRLSKATPNQWKAPQRNLWAILLQRSRWLLSAPCRGRLRVSLARRTGLLLLGSNQDNVKLVKVNAPSRPWCTTHIETRRRLGLLSAPWHSRDVSEFTFTWVQRTFRQLIMLPYVCMYLNIHTDQTHRSLLAYVGWRLFLELVCFLAEQNRVLCI